MNDKDLEELMGFLMSTGQVDENFGLKEKQDDEDDKLNTSGFDSYNQIKPSHAHLMEQFLLNTLIYP